MKKRKRKFLKNCAVEESMFNVHMDDFDNLVEEMRNKGYRQHDIQSEYDNMCYVSFKRDLINSEKIIETNISTDSTGQICDHQSRLIIVDSWESYIQEIKEGKSVSRSAVFGGMHGVTLPERATVLNLKYDDYHLTCDVFLSHNPFYHDKKMAYRIV